MGDMADYFQEQDEARLEDGVGFDDETKFDERLKETLEPSPDELYEILYKFSNYWREGWQSMEQRLSPDEALSAINSLTLKQVLAMIGPDEEQGTVETTTDYKVAGAYFRNLLRADQRKSAERIWS